MRPLILFALFLSVSTFASTTPDPAASPGAASDFATVCPKDSSENQAPCFSPDGNCGARLAAFILGARRTLDVAVYDINEPSVVGAIKAVKTRGVAVRVVCDERQSKGSHSKVAELARQVPVRFGRQRGIMHDKFTVRDGDAMETGSFNYTTHATQANQENQFYTADPSLVAAYRSRFEKMWAAGKPLAPAPAVARRKR
jgi:phosphatidylserine/phosphatidylglycerophosphate/cardiolipin synthase-like enzyme